MTSIFNRLKNGEILVADALAVGKLRNLFVLLGKELIIFPS
jgi:hypothetical protein